MNKHNKLAKNAIRARKAKNKRAGDQDKPKKGRRWLTRLGVLMGCLLLVSALVVPCFADEESSIAPAYTPSYGSAIDDFTDLLPSRQYDTAYGHLLTYYNGFGDSRFFDITMLVLGEMQSPSSHTSSISVTNSSTDGTIMLNVLVDRFQFALYTSPERYSMVSGSGSFRFTQRLNDSGSSTAFIMFYDGSIPTPSIQFNYTVAYDSAGQTYTLDGIYVGGELIDLDSLYWIDFGFVVNNDENPYYLPIIVSLLNSGQSVTYEDCVFSPRMFYNGYSLSYNLGYYDAERYAYSAGYDDGYYDGINMNDSANLGKNLLGETFTAPLKALEEFNLVSWRTANGTLVEISIMSILSAIVAVGLFFLFIKMFAGG